MTAAANGQTRTGLSWRAPASNGETAITGCRIEVSNDGSSWIDFVANIGSTATRYSHTGMTAGSARHYRVSAINPAGTGPASNVATATPATVRNRGAGPSAVTPLRYYRSADSSISSSNTQVGTDPVNGLAASGSSPESISLTPDRTGHGRDVLHGRGRFLFFVDGSKISLSPNPPKR